MPPFLGIAPGLNPQASQERKACHSCAWQRRQSIPETRRFG